MKESELLELLDNYKHGNATEGEKAILESWYLQQNEQEINEYTISERLTDAEAVWLNLQPNQRIIKTKLWIRILVAASVFLFLSLSLIYFFKNSAPSVDQLTFDKTIVPGQNKAYLTLANGKKIILTDAENGKLAEESGVEISKTKNGQLIYTIRDAGKHREANKDIAAINMISTPKGGQYQVKLPDGTTIWLNAATTIKYPASFNSIKERRIELSGEGYFEVAKAFDKNHIRIPFIVVTAKQRVEVLGTHFNINSYDDEPATRTTLLEGSVKVQPVEKHKLLKAQVLNPGQQSILQDQNIKVIKADTENTVDWKNGDFSFKGNDFKAAMRKIARWYDVEIIYDSSLETSIEPGGWISRRSNLADVLKLIESTGNVHFKVQGRRITVMK